ncbi:MAG: hypothetical protein ACYS15_08935 [Planctomycetota bacterium]|jgi:hypothetical protein
MSDSKNKPLMRSLGEFFGHIVKAVKTDPGKKRTVLEKKTQQEDRGNLTLRRTTIDEIEIHEPKDPRG